MSVFTATVSALSSLSPSVPYALAPYQKTGGALPSVFITYQLISGDPQQHADNSETMRLYRVQVNICALDGFASLPNVDAAMLAAGFYKGAERQLPRDEQTGHFILAKDYIYLEDE